MRKISSIEDVRDLKARPSLTPDEVHEVADDRRNWDSEYVDSGYSRWYITRYGGVVYLGEANDDRD